MAARMLCVAQFRWRNLAVRAEYERYESHVMGDPNQISVVLT